MSDHHAPVLKCFTCTAVFSLAAAVASVTAAFIPIFVQDPAKPHISGVWTFVMGAFVLLLGSLPATMSFALGTAFALQRKRLDKRSRPFLTAGAMGLLVPPGLLAMLALPGLDDRLQDPVPLLCALWYVLFVPGLVAFYLIGRKPNTAEKGAFPVK